MDTIDLQKRVIQFRDKRDWAQYHNPKDLAISLSLEVAELLEIFQWKDGTQVEKLKSDSQIRKKVEEELGDIFIYALTLAHEFRLDPANVILKKIQTNEKKYPVDKAKGNAKKYTELDK